jgi:hypothetical protein
MRVVVVVVWPSGWKHEARGGGLGQKPKTKPWGLDFCERCAGGVRFGLWGVDWGGVSQGLGPGSTQLSGAQGGGFGLKIENGAMGAWIRK